MLPEDTLSFGNDLVRRVQRVPRSKKAVDGMRWGFPDSRFTEAFIGSKTVDGFPRFHSLFLTRRLVELRQWSGAGVRQPLPGNVEIPS